MCSKERSVSHFHIFYLKSKKEKVYVSWTDRKPKFRREVGFQEPKVYVIRDSFADLMKTFLSLIKRNGIQELLLIHLRL